MGSAWAREDKKTDDLKSAVAKAAAFGGCKTCAESPQEQGSRDPKRECDRRFSRCIRVSFYLSDDVANPPFRVLLTKPGPGCHDLWRCIRGRWP